MTKTGYSQKLRSLNRTHRISVAALSEAIARELCEVVLTSTEDQLADIFAEPLNRIKFLQARESIGISIKPQVNM